MFELTRMASDTHLDTELAHAVDDLRGAFHGARRSVERREEPVAGGVDLGSAEAHERRPHLPVMGCEQLPPSRVADLGRALRRAHDVGEQDGREPPGGFGPGRRARHELLDRREHRLRLAGPRLPVAARQLDEGRVRDVLGEVAAALDLLHRVVGPMQDEGRNPDRRQQVAEIHLSEPLGLGDAASHPAGERHQPRDRASGPWILGERGEARSDVALPCLGHVGQPPEGCVLRVELLLRPRPRIVVGPQPRGGGAEQDEPIDPIRVGRRSEHRREAGLLRSEQERPDGVGRLHHREHVVDDLLERGRVSRGQPVRATDPPTVQDDQSAERREPPEEPVDLRDVPVRFDVGYPRGQVDEVPGSGAEHLVGDRELSAPRDARIGPRRCHEASVASSARGRKPPGMWRSRRAERSLAAWVTPRPDRGATGRARPSARAHRRR